MYSIQDRLRAHMGKADIGDVLPDCREAADTIDALVQALIRLDTLLDFGDEKIEPVWTFEDVSSIQEAFAEAKAVLALVQGVRQT